MHANMRKAAPKLLPTHSHFFSITFRCLVVAVVAAALEAQVDGGHAVLHRPGGPVAPGIRRKGQSLRSPSARFSFFFSLSPV
jgi:hypothetical protein